MADDYQFPSKEHINQLLWVDFPEENIAAWETLFRSQHQKHPRSLEHWLSVLDTCFMNRFSKITHCWKVSTPAGRILHRKKVFIYPLEKEDPFYQVPLTVLAYWEEFDCPQKKAYYNFLEAPLYLVPVDDVRLVWREGGKIQPLPEMPIKK